MQIFIGYFFSRYLVYLFLTTLGSTSLNLSYCIGFLDHVSHCSDAFLNPSWSLKVRTYYITFHFFFLLNALLAKSFMVVLEVVPTYIMLTYQAIIFTYLKFGIFVQKIQVCTSLTSWPIQSLERFSLLFRRENQVHFLLEDQQSS
jgi:hypothetical protein